MRKAKPLVGLTACTIFVFSLIAVALHAAIPADATYKETKFCVMCHKARNAEIVTGWDKTGHAHAFWKVGQEKTGDQIVADFNAAGAPCTKDCVAFVLGSGRRRQAYIGADMKVFAAEWVVTDRVWRAIPSVDATTECISCHVTGYNAAAKTWGDPFVGCQMCHGPGSAHMSSSDKTGTIVRPQTLTPHLRADICGQCHATGRDPSGKFAFPIGYLPGQEVATKFNIVKPTAHAPQQQYSELMQSKHWAANVVCDTCHDPHGVSTQPAQLKKPINALCQGCHANLPGPQHAAASLAKTTCAQCHMPDGAHFFRKP